MQVSIDAKGMRNDSVSREVFRHEEFTGCVELKRIRDWFICTPSPYLLAFVSLIIFLVNVESEGPYEPQRLLPEAIKVMREKLASIRMAAEALLTGGDDDDILSASKIGNEGDVDMADS